MRLPTFSRQSDTTAETETRPPVSARRDSSAPAAVSAGRADAGRADAGRADAGRPDAGRATSNGSDDSTSVINRQRAERDRDETTANLAPVPTTDTRTAPRSGARDSDTLHDLDTRPGATPTSRPGATPATDSWPGDAPAPVVAGPKPRASLLATLGLITGVAGALLVLSGPLLGYGIGVAGLALVLSVAGLRATRKRHIAGKTDALIGLMVSLGAIVVGVLALTGSLSWLGTDLQPVTDLRKWLDTQFIDRF